MPLSTFLGMSKEDESELPAPCDDIVRLANTDIFIAHNIKAQIMPMEMRIFWRLLFLLLPISLAALLPARKRRDKDRPTQEDPRRRRFII